jgi:glycosyltransferase involved in cell wall biosynthesis
VKIVLISADYPPAAGGVADHTYHLGHALARLGHQVQVLTSRRAHCAVSAEQGCAAVDVAPIVDSWGMAGVVSAARWVSEAVPNLVGLQYVPTMYGRGGVAPAIALLPLALRRLTGASIVGFMHELVLDWSLHPRRAVRAAAHRAQVGLLVLGCHRLVVTNLRYAELLRRWTRNRQAPSVVPVGANILPRASTAAERAAMRRDLGADEEPLLGSVSPLGVGERPEHLIAVLRALPSTRLALLGGLPTDAQRQPAVMALAQRAGVAERIRWSGYLPPRDLSCALGALDLYVHTRDVGASTRSTALVAALAHGVPTVAYRGPETADLFADGENILLAPTGAPAALADRVQLVLRSPELHARLSDGAHQLYRRHFTWSGIAQQFLVAVA